MTLKTCVSCGAKFFFVGIPPKCCDQQAFTESTLERRSVKTIPVGGPGTELTKIIPNFFSSTGCGCNAYAAKMDRWGVEGCRKKFDKIVDHLVSQSKKHKLTRHLGLVNRIVARQWVTQAIRNAESAIAVRPSNGDWFVAVTTAPRKHCTLIECVNSVRSAGWEPHIFAEPGSTQTDARTTCNNERLGVWHNWLNACRYALETDAKLILTIQDDSLFHPETRLFTESILWPSRDCGFISLYTPKHYTLAKRKTPRSAGVNRVATSCLWGACALVWDRRVLSAVIEHPIAKSWIGVGSRSGNPEVLERRRREPHLIANSDTAIGKIVNKLRRSMWFVDPSPVSHIATHSTIGHGGNSGRRNCWRCASPSVPLFEQVPRNSPVEIVV